MKTSREDMDGEIMNEIEDKIKEMDNNTCRVCKHFVRVNIDNAKNVTNRQGFCLLGQLKGDYSLYLNTSASKECMGFVFDQKIYEISKAEKELSNELRDFLDSLEDRRTKNNKHAEPLLEAQQNYFKTNMGDGMAYLQAIKALRSIGVKQFETVNQERYLKTYKMVTLRKSDYLRFMAHISVEIHNTFCSCDCIETKE